MSKPPFSHLFRDIVFYIDCMLNLAHFWPNDSTMGARRGELDPPRWPQEGSKRGLEGSKGRPGTPQRPQGEPLGRPNGGKRRQKGPKRPPRWPKRTPEEAQMSKKAKCKNVKKKQWFLLGVGQFWFNFGSILVNFG